MLTIEKKKFLSKFSKVLKILMQALRAAGYNRETITI